MKSGAPPTLRAAHRRTRASACDLLLLERRRSHCRRSVYPTNESSRVPQDSFTSSFYCDEGHSCGYAVSQELSAFADGYGFAEVVSLSEGALMVLKECEVLLSFHALRDPPHMPMAAHT